MNQKKIIIKKLIWCLMILFVSTVVILGLKPQIGEAEQVIKIGALLQLTGKWAETGKGEEKALTVGLNQVNDYLAASGLKLELEICDTECQPQKALDELQEFSKQGINIVIGPASSEEANNVIEYANQHGMLLLSPSATVTELSKKDNFFRVIPTDLNQADGLFKIMDKYTINQLAVVYLDDSYGRGMYEQLQKNSQENNVKIISTIPLSQTSPDYVSAVNKLENETGQADPNKTAILIIDSGQDAAEFIKNIPATSTLAKMKWLAGAEIIDSKAFLADKSVAAFAAATQMEGLSLGYKGVSLDALPYVNYVLEGAADISPYALSTWDGLWLIAETYRKNPQANIEDLKTTLVNTAANFRNSSGFISVMDENGDILGCRYLRYQLYSDNNGNYVWQCKGHYLKPVQLPPIFKTIIWNISQEEGEVQVGALLPLKGNLAEQGKEVEAVLEEAVDCFNQYSAACGSGIKIHLIVEDTEGNPQKAVVATKKLIEQGVKNIIGPLSSEELAQIEPICNLDGVLAISPLSTAPSLSKHERIYRTIMNDTHQIQALTALMKQDNIKKVIILNRDDTYGQELAKTFTAAYDGKVFPLSYDLKNMDLQGLINQAEQLAQKEGTENTAVLLIAYDESIDIMKLLQDSNSLANIRWYGTDSTAQSEALINDKKAAQIAAQVKFTAPGYTAYGNYFDPIYYVLNYRLKDKISHSLKESSVSAFDDIWMIGCAYLENGTSADLQTINDYIKGSVYRGISGLINLSENGDRSVGYYKLYSIEDNEGRYGWTNTGIYSIDYAKNGVLEMY